MFKKWFVQWHTVQALSGLKLPINRKKCWYFPNGEKRSLQVLKEHLIRIRERDCLCPPVAVLGDLLGEGLEGLRREIISFMKRLFLFFVNFCGEKESRTKVTESVNFGNFSLVVKLLPVMDFPGRR